MTLGRAERHSLERGQPVVVTLESKRPELAIFSAIQLGPDVAPERAAAWMRRVEDLRRSRHMLASGRFSTPPRQADLDDLVLDEGDLEDIRRCRPGACDVKLSAREIGELMAITAAATQWRDEVQVAFRQILLRRVLAYMSGGLAALDATADRRSPRPPAAAFASILERSTFLQEHMPDLAERLASCRTAGMPDAETFIYWSKERLGGKAVITATHVTLVEGDAAARPYLLSIGVQIFATHYLDASLGVTALVRDSQSSQMYLVYIHRAHVDVLEGFWGRFARPIIEGRVRKDGAAALRQVRARISGGDPPRAPLRIAAPQP